MGAAVGVDKNTAGATVSVNVENLVQMVRGIGIDEEGVHDAIRYNGARFNSILDFGHGQEPNLMRLQTLGLDPKQADAILNEMHKRGYLQKEPGKLEKQKSEETFYEVGPVRPRANINAKAPIADVEDDLDHGSSRTMITAFENGKLVVKPKRRRFQMEDGGMDAATMTRKLTIARVHGVTRHIRWDIGHKFEQPGWEGHYEIMKAIGIGAYGEVYEVKETWTHHNSGQQEQMQQIARLAMKCVNFSKMHTEADSADEEHLNLCQEASLMAKVGAHANIISLRRVMQNDDTFLVLLDLVEGHNLKELVSSNQLYENASPDELVDRLSKLAFQLALALEHCHSKRILHQDVKPENVMIHKVCLCST
jgi:hypothetical protein